MSERRSRQREESPVDDIHYIAERFLAELAAVGEGKLEEPQKKPFVPHVYIIRGTTPHLFCGFKNNTKTPVWAHDFRFAKLIRHEEHPEWLDALEKLGEPSLAVWA